MTFKQLRDDARTQAEREKRILDCLRRNAEIRSMENQLAGIESLIARTPRVALLRIRTKEVTW